MKKKIFKWSIISLISVLSFSGISGGVVAFCLTNLQKPIYEGELFKSISLIDSDEYLPTEYEIPLTANYDNAYFQSLGFEITNNVNVGSFGIKNVYLNKMNDDIGNAKLIIEFHKYKTIEIKVDNFLDKARWLDINLNVNELINNSTVSYLYKNKELLTNQLKLNDVSVSLNQVKYEIKNYDDKQALLILKCSTDTKKRSIRLRTKVDGDTLLKAIVDTSRVSNAPTNLTPSLFHEKYSMIDQIFDLSSLKYSYDSELLTCSPYINDPSRSLIYKLSYNGQTFDYVIKDLYSDNEFNQYNLFNKIKYTTPYNVKFHNSKSLYEPNLSSNLDNLKTLGFFDIDKNVNLNNLDISYLNDENKFVLTYSVDKQVFQREFNIQIFEFDKSESAIDSNLTTLLNDFSKIDSKKMELKSDKNSSYQKIRSEIDSIFNDVFLSDIDKTFNNQLSTLLYNLVTEFVSYNTFKKVSNNQADMKNYLLLLLNSFQLKYESQMVDQQLVFDIQLTIYNNESLNLGELIFPYKETKESETTKNLVIRKNEKLLLNWTNIDSIDGKLNLEPIRTDGILNAGINGFSLRAYYFDNRSRGNRGVAEGLEIFVSVMDGINFVTSIAGLVISCSPFPLKVLGIVVSAVGVLTSFVSKIVEDIVSMFIPSEIALRYNEPLDLSYNVEDPIWDVYINGKKANKGENEIVESFHTQIENKHKLTIDMKANIYNLIERIIKYDKPNERSSDYLINNDTEFLKSLIAIILPFATNDNIKIFYDYMLLVQLHNSNSDNLNSNFNDFLSIAINNKISELFTDQMDAVTKDVLKSINNNLLLELVNFNFSDSPTYLNKKIVNIDTYLNSQDFVNFIYDYIYTFLPSKSINLVNSIVQIIKNEWRKIKNIYNETIIFLDKVVQKYNGFNKNLPHLKQVLQYETITLISLKIINFFDKNNLNKEYLNQLLSNNGLKIHSIIPMLRIVSYGNTSSAIPKIDILSIISNYIWYKNFDWNLITLSDAIIFLKNIHNIREIYIKWYGGGPFTHSFKFYKMQIWQVRKMFQFFLNDISDEEGKNYNMSELLRSLEWTYSYSTNYEINEFEKTLSIKNMQLRTILDGQSHKYMLNFSSIYSIFYDDKRTAYNSIFSFNDWGSWYKVWIKSYSSKLEFINSQQDYFYLNLLENNSNIYSYKIMDDNSIAWDYSMNLCIPKIPSNLIDRTTNNLFKNVQIGPNNQAHPPYFINIMKDFIKGFYLLTYDIK